MLAAEASRSTHGRTAATKETAVTGRAQKALDSTRSCDIRGWGWCVGGVLVTKGIQFLRRTAHLTILS